MHLSDVFDQLAFIITNKLFFVFLALFAQQFLGIPVLLKVQFCVEFLIAIFTLESCPRKGHACTASFFGKMNSLEMLLHSFSTEKIQVTVGTFDKIVPHDEILSESGGKGSNK